MKKIITLVIAFAIMSASSMFVFADNAVSNMAVEKGGMHIAQCAKMMDKGISECAKMDICNK
ncbi:MAG: hypothetical protein ACOZCL_00080 [Bacillota bacterium]